MRPVDKGAAPSTYTEYKDARNDLAKRVGWYCSYCEMPVKNMIEVEHVIPKKKRPDLETDWDNFLLSCRYCNGVKKDRNDSREGYLWPDQDNVDLVFDYDQINVIAVRAGVPSAVQITAQNTIDLLGLDRIWGGANEPTNADTRPFSRQEAWIEATESLARWYLAPIKPMAEQIAPAARGFGHYSIWYTVFSNEKEILEELQIAFPGTYFQIDPDSGQRLVRDESDI